MIAIAIARRGTAHELTRPGRAGAPPGEPRARAPAVPARRPANQGHRAGRASAPLAYGTRMATPSASTPFASS
jgi:hypothetical protein